MLCLLLEAVDIKIMCLCRYQEALPYFNQACLHNCEPGLTKDLGSCGLDPKMLAYFRRVSLQVTNRLHIIELCVVNNILFNIFEI